MLTNAMILKSLKWKGFDIEAFSKNWGEIENVYLWISSRYHSVLRLTGKQHKFRSFIRPDWIKWMTFSILSWMLLRETVFGQHTSRMSCSSPFDVERLTPIPFSKDFEAENEREKKSRHDIASNKCQMQMNDWGHLINIWIYTDQELKSSLDKKLNFSPDNKQHETGHSLCLLSMSEHFVISQDWNWNALKLKYEVNSSISDRKLFALIIR